ncbi:MAG: endoribonuclease L-PSP [Comamonadaceae bacterium]|nr:MAG: endoribonuclease L-PSP [Comamonadaceae bacterium]
MTHTIQRHRSNARMSKIVQHGGLIFLCGQTSSGTALARIGDQTSEVLRRIDALLAEVGSDRSHLLSATVYLNQIEDFAALNAVWEAWVSNGCAPASTTVQANLASTNLLIECPQKPQFKGGSIH